MPPDPPDPEEFEKEREARETDEDTDETQPMTEDKNADTAEASGIEAEITTIRDKGALENLTSQHTGGNKWTVLSARNGSVDAYRVDTTEPSCTCEHSDFNGEDTEACAHIIYCLLHGERTVPEEAYQAARVHAAVDKLRDVREDVKTLYATLDEERVRQLSNGEGTHDKQNDDTAPPATPEGAYDGTQRGEDMANAPDPEEEAEKLQSAFDEVVQDMEVEAYDGKVWFKTGYNTPDNLPFPGKPDTWEVLVKNPDMAEYDEDIDSPGKYFKNYLTPGKVDDYISEVLE